MIVLCWLTLLLGRESGYEDGRRDADRAIEQKIDGLVNERIDQRVHDETGISIPKWKAIESLYQQQKKEKPHAGL